MTATDTTNRPHWWPLVWGRAKTEMKVFFREWDSLIFVFLFPIFFLMFFSAVFGGSDVGMGVDFKQYFVPAMIASGIIYTGFQYLATVIPVERDQGVLKRLRGTPLPPSAYFAGKILMIYGVAMAQVITLLLIAKFILGVPLPTELSAWLTFAWVFTLGVGMSAAIGIGFSSVPRSGKSAAAVVVPPVILLQFISGVYIPFHELPEGMQQVGDVFPLKWLAQGMRSVFLPDEFSAIEARQSWELGTGAIVVAAWFVVGIIGSLLFFRWRTRKDG